MQGIEVFIPTKVKVRYLNHLLRVGFDTLDFGSFVSPKAIPQMKDTAEVLSQLDLSTTSTDLLVIVANLKGAQIGSEFDEITYLGFPLSISETFQQRNTNKSIAEALAEIQEIQELCQQKGKELVVYISMGFGNPYGDPYSLELVQELTSKLDSIQIKIISLADTIGVSNEKNISSLFEKISTSFPHIEFGSHLHSNPVEVGAKLEAAYQAGCRRFDGALGGYGGCPMAKDELVGNIATEKIIDFLESKNVELDFDREEIRQASQLIPLVFS